MDSVLVERETEADGLMVLSLLQWDKVIVMDERTVLHVGMPSVRLMPLERLLLPQRQPVVRVQ